MAVLLAKKLKQLPVLTDLAIIDKKERDLSEAIVRSKIKQFLLELVREARSKQIQ